MKTRKAGFLSAVVVAAAMLAAGCGSDGDNSDVFVDKLGQPLPSATDEQLATFERGRAVASRRFGDSDGLGPDFNVVSCAHCHEKPVLGGSAARYRDFLLVRAVLGDGSSIPVGVNGVQPQYTLHAGGRRPTDPGTNLEANRNPIPFFGVGLLAAIPEDEILRHVDETDSDGDGISGRANYDRGFVGRFGRKAQTVSIEGFIRGPLFNHLGITTDPLSDDKKALLPVPSAAFDDAEAFLREARELDFRALASMLVSTLVPDAIAQVAAPEEPNFDDDGVADPELSEDELFDLVSFAMLLAPPRPDAPTEASMHGEGLFDLTGCTSCHVPALEGPSGSVPAYSDLLLHDMGEELADGLDMGVATGSEFRTQPLWGIVASAPYLHDGRADTLDEAIRAHGGEGRAARDAYVALTAGERGDLLAFLASLGGASQRSEGLLAPDAPVIEAGMIGGPDSELSTVERELFALGRAVFDRDFALSAGLGPRFNGDSCRACHFQPVIGGAGPVGVDVSRHGFLTDGVFTAPAQGTMAHRFSTDGTRPPIDENANAFETRQTPPVFGLGFLESIPRADILANADCANADPTAISGCAHLLDDGRLGRLGWKANVPSLAEFARDAMLNEMGITLPDIAGQTFGKSDDDDDVADPEIDVSDLQALVFYMQRLAPPPRRSTDAAAEAAGEQVFDEIGCTACHVAEFETDDGIKPYTDLLLHQVAADGAVGVGDGQAGPLDIRTTPLWGLGRTAPYMHDGRSFTIEAAIVRHEAEAGASVGAYSALSAGDKADLIAFLESL